MKLFVGVKTWTFLTTIVLGLAVFFGIVVHGWIVKPPQPAQPAAQRRCTDEAAVRTMGHGQWECDARTQTLSAERLWADVFLYRCTCNR